MIDDLQIGVAGVTVIGRAAALLAERGGRLDEVRGRVVRSVRRGEVVNSLPALVDLVAQGQGWGVRLGSVILYARKAVVSQADLG